MATLAELFEYFDEVRCINLISRDDRMAEAQSVFDQYDIPVQFYRTQKHPDGGIRGCFESHMAVIKQAYKNKAKTLLVFEDDVMATSYLTVNHLKTAIDFMSTNQHWDLFYLGTHPEIRHYRVQPISTNIYQMHSICTHAYVISRRMMRAMVKRMRTVGFDGTAIDYLYATNHRSYGIYPSVFGQRGSVSDISSDFTSQLSIKHHWFRAVELYAKYINLELNLTTRFVFMTIVVMILLMFAYRRYSPQ